MIINGIVQGVGFRPFIYQSALRFELKGHVANTAAGVRLDIEGTPAAITAFIAHIRFHPPPLARILGLKTASTPWVGHEDFRILKSSRRGRRSTSVPPDAGICRDCAQELSDPGDRRYGYPFINCTNCGPRYTIIRDLPYDREQTTMQPFMMCARCRDEYLAPDDRRFHAQPNACPACGPGVTLLDRQGQEIHADDPLSVAARMLKHGEVLAVKGLGGFHLAVDACNPAAVQRLRRRKHRPHKPLALMSPDLDAIRSFAHVSPREQVLLSSSEKPIVLLRKKHGCVIDADVAPDNDCLGVMLPYTPLHLLLLDQGFTALVMTSGNASGEPLVKDNGEAFERLTRLADYFLIHDRDIHMRADDSIARIIAGRSVLLRRSRGYAPAPIRLPHRAPPILAVGADQKNTICLTKDRQAFVSPYIGELDQVRTHDVFTATIAHLKMLLAIRPTIIAHDLHPQYRSSAFAHALPDVQKTAVQHHHAHVAACMLENRLVGPVIGLAFDGTGYGSDGRLWGGEVLVADAAAFQRKAHLAYVPMPGGEAAIREPWRMAVSYLHDAWGDDMWHLDLPLLQRMARPQVETLLTMAARGINSPHTSSIGRLFDAAAAILDIRQEVSFEGQAAMGLEYAARGRSAGGYPLEWSAAMEISVRPLVRGIAADMVAHRPRGLIAMKFHQTLIDLFAGICEEISWREGIKQVVLSGGVFQNRIMSNGLSRHLRRRGLSVFTHHLVPANDGGISLGQAAVAAARASV